MYGNVKYLIGVLSSLPEIADETRQTYEDDDQLRNYIINHLFDFCLKYIDTKALQQLRDVAQTVLFYFINKDYVSREQVEEKAWPIIRRMVLDVKSIMDLHADGIMVSTLNHIRLYVSRLSSPAGLSLHERHG